MRGCQRITAVILLPYNISLILKLSHGLKTICLFVIVNKHFYNKPLTRAQRIETYK